MDRVTDVAAAVESTVDALMSVLDGAGQSQSPSVPPAQLRVLAILAENSQTNMSRLAETLEVVPSSASRLCDRLEATGLLRRVPDPRDRREVRLMVTPAGRRLLERLRESRREALAEVLERMPATDRQDLVRSLRSFAEAAGNATEESSDGNLRTA